jgi:hypothetical protein
MGVHPVRVDLPMGTRRQPRTVTARPRLWRERVGDDLHGLGVRTVMIPAKANRVRAARPPSTGSRSGAPSNGGPAVKASCAHQGSCCIPLRSCSMGAHFLRHAPGTAPRIFACSGKVMGGQRPAADLASCDAAVARALPGGLELRVDESTSYAQWLSRRRVPAETNARGGRERALRARQ